MKPTVETNIRPTCATIDVLCEDDARREAAIVAALTDAGAWGVRKGDRVEIHKPRHEYIGGGALREAVKDIARSARDAAKAALKNA